MEQHPSVEKTYSLEHPFLIRVPWEINNFFVSSFNGDPANTLLRFEREETDTEHRIQLRWGLTNLEGRTIWICNKKAQPGKSLTIIYTDTPVEIVTGVPYIPAEPNDDDVHAYRYTVGANVTTPPFFHAPHGRAIIFRAHPGNTVVVFLGGLDVTTDTGYPLVAGDAVGIYVSDAARVGAITATADAASNPQICLLVESERGI